MDLYRYFHPHHNPRLRNAPLRLVELCELEQAAHELERALKRASIRSELMAKGEDETEESDKTFEEERYEQVALAMNYVVTSLRGLLKAHPGDNSEDLKQMSKEREKAPGWENWVKLLNERLKLAETISSEEKLAQGTGN